MTRALGAVAAILLLLIPAQAQSGTNTLVATSLAQGGVSVGVESFVDVLDVDASDRAIGAVRALASAFAERGWAGARPPASAAPCAPSR